MELVYHDMPVSDAGFLQDECGVPCLQLSFQGDGCHADKGGVLFLLLFIDDFLNTADQTQLVQILFRELDADNGVLELVVQVVYFQKESS